MVLIRHSYVQEFVKPIISPYELEIALQPEPKWTGKYVLDFNELLANAAQQEYTSETRPTEDDNEEKPMFSMVTGKYRHAKRYGIENGTCCSSFQLQLIHDDFYLAHDTPSEIQSLHGTIVLRNRDTALSKQDDRAAGERTAVSHSCVHLMILFFVSIVPSIQDISRTEPAVRAG